MDDTQSLSNMSVTDTVNELQPDGGCKFYDGCDADAPCKHWRTTSGNGMQSDRCACGESWSSPAPDTLRCVTEARRASDTSPWYVVCTTNDCTYFCEIAGPYQQTIPCHCSSTPYPQ